ncbi:MAG: hypothetical protein ACYTG2_10500 [Planctomycetota bacterium]
MKVLIVTRDWASWPHFAGSTWVPMQYVLGFRQLGIEAVWIDHLSAVDAAGPVLGPDYMLGRFAATADDFGYADRWCVVYDGGKRFHGLDAQHARELVEDAALLLSLSGRGLPTTLPLDRVPVRAYVDVDPAFTQVWATQTDMGLSDYNLHFTVGRTLGQPGCRAPDLGLDWIPIFPPVALDAWPARIDPRCTRFTTIGDWWGDQMTGWEGECYAGKREEFLALLDLPQRSGKALELALSIYQGDHEDIGLLTRHGWTLHDPARVAGDPHAYREFIARSRAEFSVAKSGYVKSQCGWLSDRTVCYLASGKPALVQSTGLEAALPTGTGLLTFRTPADALAGLADIDARYVEHATAARHLAEEHFDARKVLAGMLAHAGLQVPAR